MFLFSVILLCYDKFDGLVIYRERKMQMFFFGSHCGPEPESSDFRKASLDTPIKPGYDRMDIILMNAASEQAGRFLR